MNDEYISLFVGEVRAIELTVRDQDDVDFIPDGVSVTIKDFDAVDIITDQVAVINTNRISTLITTEVSSVAGIYFIIWKITKEEAIYYHKTIINIREII